MALSTSGVHVKNIDAFTGRIWLLPEILKWWDHGDQRTFLITGGPGTGKTMLLAWIAGFGPLPDSPPAIEQIRVLRSSAKAVHFCQARSGNNSPHAFASNVVSQLCANIPQFNDAFAATLEMRVKIIATQTVGTVLQGEVTNLSIQRIDLSSFGDEYSFDQAFSQPIKRLYENGYEEPILLIVDALDEAQTYSTKLATLLSGLDDLPPQVRVLASTRSVPLILSLFRNRAELCDLVVDCPTKTDDVRAYADIRLAQATSITRAERELFAQRLASRANGTFLFATSVLDQLFTSSPKSFPDLSTYHLPDGLSDVYHGFILRELGCSADNWIDVYEPLLGLICIGQGSGITTQTLSAITGTDVRKALHSCKQYLEGEMPEGPFRPFHTSFSEYLLRDPSNRDFHIDEITMHRRMALHLWNRHAKDWSTCDAYGALNLALHLYEGQLFDVLGVLISPEWMNFKLERANYMFDEFAADLSLAWKAALRCAEADVTAGRDPPSLATCLKCAFVKTHISAVSSDISPILIRGALKTGAWSAINAFSMAARRSGPRSVQLHIATLGAANFALDTKHREYAANRVLTDVRAIPDQEDRILAMVTLVHGFEADRREVVLQEILELMQAVKPGQWRDVMTVLALHATWCSNGNLSQSLGTANKIIDVPQQVGNHRASLGLPAAEHAFRILGSIVSHELRILGLVYLASTSSGPIREAALQRAIETVKQVSKADEKARLIATVAPLLEVELRETMLNDALAAAIMIDGDAPRASALATLLPQVAEDVSLDAVCTLLAQSVGSEGPDLEAESLKVIEPYLTDASIKMATQVVYALPDAKKRARAIGVLLPRMDSFSRAKAVEYCSSIVQGFDNPYERILEALPFLGYLDTLVARDIIAQVDLIDDLRMRSSAIVALIPRLPDGVEEESLKLALEIKYLNFHERMATRMAMYADPSLGAQEHRIAALTAVAARATGQLKMVACEEAIAVARTLDEGEAMARALIAIAPHLSEETRQDVVLEAWLVLERSSPSARVDYLENLSFANLPTILTRNVYSLYPAAERFFAIASEIEMLLTRPIVRLALESNMGKTHASIALDAIKIALAVSEEIMRTQIYNDIRRIESTSLRAQALASFAVASKGFQRETAARESLDLSSKLISDDDLSFVLIHLSHCLPQEQLLTAATVAKKITSAQVRSRVLSALASQIKGSTSEAVWTDALKTIFRAKNDFVKFWILGEIVPVLPRVMLRTAVDFASEAFGGLGPQLDSILNGRLCDLTGDDALAVLRDMESPTDQTLVLEQIAPALSEEQLHFAAHEVMRRKSTYKWKPQDVLIKLAPHLRGPLITEAFDLLKRTHDDSTRCELICGLGPKLNDEEVQIALTITAFMKEPKHTARAIASILPMTTPSQRQFWSEFAIEATRAIPDKASRTLTLASLLPAMSDSQRETALQDVITWIGGGVLPELTDLQTLLTLVEQQLSPTERGRIERALFRKLLFSIRAVTDDGLKLKYLAMLAPKVESSLFPQCLVVARSAGTEKGRAANVMALAETIRCRNVCQKVIDLPAVGSSDQDNAWLNSAISVTAKFKDFELQALTLVALNKSGGDSKRIAMLIRQLVVRELSEEERTHRKASVFSILCYPEVCRAAMFSRNLIETIVKDVLETTRRWEWS